MEVVWHNPPVTARQVTDALGEREGWKPQTIKTLISRLVKKGALQYEVEGKRFLYSPLIEREAAVDAETDSFLNRVSRGSFVPMLSHLVGIQRPLEKEEIEVLRDLLKNEEDQS